MWQQKQFKSEIRIVKVALRGKPKKQLVLHRAPHKQVDANRFKEVIYDIDTWACRRLRPKVSIAFSTFFGESHAQQHMMEALMTLLSFSCCHASKCKGEHITLIFRFIFLFRLTDKIGLQALMLKKNQSSHSAQCCSTVTVPSETLWYSSLSF